MRLLSRWLARPDELTWLKNKGDIFRLAQAELGWLAQGPVDDFLHFVHAEGEEYVSAWPIRLHWGAWCMPEPRPEPRTGCCIGSLSAG